MANKVINKEQFADYKFNKEDFEFAKLGSFEKDKKLETKAIGYLEDAFRRFCKNKSSVVAGIIIVILVLYAIIAPLCVNKAYQDSFTSNIYLTNYKQLLPKADIFEGTGFWDGTKVIKEASSAQYDIYRGIEKETGHDTVKLLDVNEVETVLYTKVNYKIRVDSYYGNGVSKLTLTKDKYDDIQRWQDENKIQVILPQVQTAYQKSDNSVWYKTTPNTMNAVYAPGTIDENGIGEFIPAYEISTGRDDYFSSMRISLDTEKNYSYAQRSGTKENGYTYTCRIDSYNYFVYMYGFEPSFLFGTDNNGFDIFSRLARGARFSLILALSVSIINLAIGAIYGAIEGYYGGVVDIVMERISDILANVPFTIVAVLFSLHFADKVGMVGSLFFAFVLTGWIGMASRVRMQFYRFKNQEYVLSARTLGASDFRIITKHVFPNSLGTLITGSVLVIPGVIFSETSLTYLHIIDLNSSSMSSVGQMLADGQSVMSKAPHCIFFPALFIALLEICFNLFGNGLRDAFNPALRGSEE